MENPRSDTGRYRIQSVDRAMDVLFAFTRTRDALDLTEISRITGLSKSTAFRILVTLSFHNVITYDEATRRYSLGFGVLHLADVRRHQRGLPGSARHLLVALRDALNETVGLSVRVGNVRVCIESVESHHEYRRAPETGESVPLYAGAVGKLFLAGMSDEELEAYLDATELVPRGPHTITDRDTLLREVAKVRENGYSESFGERSRKGGAAAAPIYGPSGDVAATVHVSVPQDRLTPQMRERCIRSVLATAEQITIEIGGSPRARLTPARGAR